MKVLGMLLAGLGAVVFVLAMYSNVDTRLLAAISATALVLAGVYLMMPVAVTARASYRIQPAFQGIAAAVALIVAAGLGYATQGRVDWTLAIGIAIGVLIGSGFLRGRKRRRS